ncbi:SDR family oxidoreductase [Leisingera sp. S232]|uniref:SDR family oxidoreductase n=1 Tax=Leisingera sp. S232 TaxID=3415132 RepID=UPI00086EFAF5|nr:3-hydroxyacyl-CoA dehydrogenase [Rhodobacteraceae bacterium (ex Bugula neritina AB1)]
MKQPNVEGRTIVVTGGARGVGRAISIALGARGANVVVNDIGAELDGAGRTSGPAEETAAEIRKLGGQAIVNTGSVAEPDEAQGMIRDAVAAFGRVDGVVNNAGILRDGFFHKMSYESFKAVIDVHLMGTFNVSRSAAGFFRDQKGGALVHMTSTTGLIGNLGQANYAAAKLGIVALSKSIALDMQRYNVRSNCIAPFAWSRMFSNLPSETPEQQKRIERMKKMTPESVAPLAVYLLSDAAHEISGQIFGVRANEVYLFHPTGLERSVHTADGWTPETIADHAMPSLSSSFASLNTSPEFFSWDPV